MAFPIQEQIRDRIEEFLTELDALVRKAAVESVAQALQGRGAAASRAPRGMAPQAVAGSQRRTKGQKRDPNELEQLTLLAYVVKNSGQRIELIAKAIGNTTKELALPAKKLIADKKLRTFRHRSEHLSFLPRHPDSLEHGFELRAIVSTRGVQP